MRCNWMEYRGYRAAYKGGPMKLKILTVGVIIIGSIWFYPWNNTNNTTVANNYIQYEPRITTVTAKTRALSNSSRDNKTVQQVYEYESTAYTWTGYRTASGRYPVEGRTVAVDPDIIPLGSVIEINGHKYIAEDTGRLIKGRRIDVYMGRDKEKAIKWGIKQVRVRIIKEN